MRVHIEGTELPGRSCAPDTAGRRYANVHVGVQRGKDVVDLVRADATSAQWSFDVRTRLVEDGSLDVGGPFVHGRRGDRFLYLSWGTVDDAGRFTMFRRAKLMFADIEPATLRAAADGDAVLVGRITLTDSCGNPRCARVREPDLRWLAESAVAPPPAVRGSGA
ncbi:MAG: DUF5990 family protein [Pseudonocardia sp.]